MDHHPHRHPCPALVRRERIRCHPGHFRRKAGARPAAALPRADIGCCICATLSAPDATPSVACQMQAALGLPESCPALDVNAACSGFLYGIRRGARTAGNDGRTVCPRRWAAKPSPA
ncbi:MAG: hypothetical protein ACLS34_02810 [Faecalibacterium sp.]